MHVWNVLNIMTILLKEPFSCSFFDIYSFPSQWLVKCQYRVMAIFLSQVWYKRYDQVDTRKFSAWHINHWLKMYCNLPWTMIIMRCFHKNTPQGFQRCNKPHILPQIVKNICIVKGNIAIDIFKHLLWFDVTRKIEEFCFKFCCSLLSIVILLITLFFTQAILLIS